jgi:hypothetical protein
MSSCLEAWYVFLLGSMVCLLAWKHGMSSCLEAWYVFGGPRIKMGVCESADLIRWLTRACV